MVQYRPGAQDGEKWAVKEVLDNKKAANEVAHELDQKARALLKSRGFWDYTGPNGSPQLNESHLARLAKGAGLDKPNFIGLSNGKKAKQIKWLHAEQAA